MQQKKISRFSLIVVIIGWLIAIPSILGVLFSIVLFFAVGDAGNQIMSEAVTDAEKTGAAVYTGISFGVTLFLAVSSLIGGLIGYLLIMKKKVWQCLSCGFIIDRA